MVHENADELVADRALQECRQNRRIDASRKAQQHLIRTDLCADARHAVLDDAAGGPISFAAGDLAHETAQDLAALQGMRDLRMKLQRVKAPGFVRHGGERRIVAVCNHGKARRRRGHPVAVAHPHVEHAAALCVPIVLESIEQPGWSARFDLREAEFAMGR